MAKWYKHDIAAWMDGTEHLDAGPYRVYHVICQLIYLNEKPIQCNENGIAGRCHQSVRMFRRNLEILISEQLIFLENGRLMNTRAKMELEKMGANRENAGKGGKAKAKALKNNEAPLAPPPDAPALRLEEKREEETIKKKDGADAPVDPPDKAYFIRARQVLGPKAGGSMGAKILKVYEGSIPQATILIERASEKADPMSYINKALSNIHDPTRGLHGRF